MQRLRVSRRRVTNSCSVGGSLCCAAGACNANVSYAFPNVTLLRPRAVAYAAATAVSMYRAGRQYRAFTDKHLSWKGAPLKLISFLGLLAHTILSFSIPCRTPPAYRRSQQRLLQPAAPQCSLAHLRLPRGHSAVCIASARCCRYLPLALNTLLPAHAYWRQTLPAARACALFWRTPLAKTPLSPVTWFAAHIRLPRALPHLLSGSSLGCA